MTQNQAKEFPSVETLTQIYRAMFAVRTIDGLEAGYAKRGGGLLHVGSQGAELSAVLAAWLSSDDHLLLHWRDRAIRLAQGVTVGELAAAYFAVPSGEGLGKNLTCHESSRAAQIHPVATPTPSQCTPAIGVAFSLANSRSQGVVLCSLGDGATRQGEFGEAWLESLEHELPVIWLVSDNGWAISTPTVGRTAIDLGLIQRSRLVAIESTDPHKAIATAADVVSRVRGGGGPMVIHHRCPRLSGHTSNDFERVYRSQDDRDRDQTRDPLTAMRAYLIECRGFTEASLEHLEASIATECETAYRDARSASEFADGSPTPHAMIPPINVGTGIEAASIAEAFRETLGEILEKQADAILIGEDVADPQGGVFRLTQGLSTRFPDRVQNSPLAEATILGTAFGYATTGKLAIAEIQFMDFLAPAWNQLTTNITPLAWRTDGAWSAPIIMYAPAGGYTPGAGMFHSQVNAGLLVRQEGLIVGFPSNPTDARRMLLNAASHDGPTFLILPKATLFSKQLLDEAISIGPRSRNASTVRNGEDVTIATWGHGVPICQHAVDAVEHCSADLIDMRYLNPLDVTTVVDSIARTGRLIVFDEDWGVCSVGSELVARTVQSPGVLGRLKASPILLSRKEQFFARTASAERDCLPQIDDVVKAIRHFLPGERS